MKINEILNWLNENMLEMVFGTYLDGSFYCYLKDINDRLEIDSEDPNDEGVIGVGGNFEEALQNLFEQIKDKKLFTLTVNEFKTDYREYKFSSVGEIE